MKWLLVALIFLASQSLSAPIVANLEAWLPLETNARDISGNGYDFTTAGTVTYGTTAGKKAATGWSAANYLVGPLALRTALAAASFGNGSTVEAEIRFTSSAAASQVIWDLRGGGLTAIYDLRPNSISNYLTPPGSTTTSTFSASTNVWHSFVWVANGTNTIMYVDNQPYVTTDTPTFSAVTSAYIGNEVGLGYPCTACAIRNVRVWSVAKTGPFPVPILPDNAINYEFLLIGGGGSPGFYLGGGAGAGGYLTSTTMTLVDSGVYPVVIGDGGVSSSGPSGQGQNGGNSTFNYNTAIGGGRSNTEYGGGVTSTVGGSGGGGVYTAGFRTPSAGILNQGYIGGWYTAGHGNVSGGGGGAGAAGGNSSNKQAGAGGAGLAWVDGVTRCGGGGGGGYNGTTDLAGAGGAGGGGAGASINGASGTNGTANTGGGGGGGAGGGGSARGGDGGSGIFIIRYLTSQVSVPGQGGVITTSGGYHYHTFLSSGNFVAADRSLFSTTGLTNTNQALPVTGQQRIQ